MQPKSNEEIKNIILKLKENGDYSEDLDLWSSIYESLTPELKLEISNSLEKELSRLNK